MGLELTEYLRYAGALFFVLALIGLLVWALRRFGSGKMSANGKRGRRLAVTEAAMVDKRRRLVLIRRDNQEHLIMIGGPQDLVIETGITPQHVMADHAPQTQFTQTPIEPPRPPEEPLAPRRPERRTPMPPPPPSRPRTMEREPMPERPPRPVSVAPPEREQPYSEQSATEQSATAQERRSLLNVRPGETR